jgi:predicted alpha/beta-fold hydrolase
MAARLRRRHALMPDRFSIDRLPYVKTVYEFDDHITAPFFGFGTAEGYYSTQSSRLYLDTIRIPTLLIHAQDDPMIPFHVYDHPAFRSNPHLTLVTPPHGGHVGFLARGAQGRFWIDQTICAWLATHGEQTPPHSRL